MKAMDDMLMVVEMAEVVVDPKFLWRVFMQVLSFFSI